MNLLFTMDYGAENFDLLRREGHTVNYVSETEPCRELTEEEKSCDVIIGYNFFEKYPLSGFPNLRYIQLVSVGFNHIPIEEIRRLNLPVCHNVGMTRWPIAEWVLWMILSSYKCANQLAQQQKDHVWQPLTGGRILELTGKTVMFLGAGNIPQEVARKLKAFDAKTVALNLDTEPVPNIDEIYLIGEIDRLIGDADILICCLPATPATYHMLNSDRFALMKDDAVLVNISRGTVVNECDLIKALKNGKFRNVCLDVFETEPLDTESPLWDMDRVLITPHTAIESDLSYQRVFDMICRNIRHAEAGEPLENPVHYERGF